VRPECLDWTLIWNRCPLRRISTEYLHHYNTAWPHQSPDLRSHYPARALALVESSIVQGPVRRFDVLGG
jgi:putative transposase